MKKRTLFAILPLVSMLATGCDFLDSIFGKKANYSIKLETLTGGTKAEQEAILKAVNSKPLCFPSSSRQPCYADKVYTFREDKGDNLFLAKSQKMGDLNVKVEWEIDKSQEYYGSYFTEVEEGKDLVELKYKGFNQDGGTFEWRIKKISCGGASAVNDKALKYKVKTKNFTYKHDVKTIAELNSITTTEKTVHSTDETAVYKFSSTLDALDYTFKGGSNYTYYPSFAGNNSEIAAKGEDHLYVCVNGKVIYLSTDGNWGLIANGDQVMEIYAGAGTKLLPKNFPNIGVGKFVKVYGNMSHYLGNIQIGFIYNVRKGEECDVSVDYNSLGDDISYLWEDSALGYESHRQFIPGLLNSLRTVEGTVKANSLKGSDGKTTTVGNLKIGKRFTFDITVGGKDLTVAYDYHTQTDGGSEIYDTKLFESFKSKYTAGGNITVKGVMRWGGNDKDKNPFISLAYKKASVTNEADFNSKKSTLFTRSGDDFTSAASSSYNSGTMYYTRSDLNKIGRWSIVPMVYGDLA